MHDVIQLQQIGASGGGMILDADKFTAIQLQQIAASAKGLVILKRVSGLTIVQCQGIAASGKGKVIFDFTSDG
jgi:hypothetical protein